MYANNEIGTIEPIKELAEAIRNRRIAAEYARRGQARSDAHAPGDDIFPLLHTDACQAAGALPLNVSELGVDLMTLNGSKIYGPKGIGMLYKRNTVPMSPIIVGGEQERLLRAGTESVPLIVGFAEALARAERSRLAESERLTLLRDCFIDLLLRNIPGAILNGHTKLRLPNNVHISIPHIEGESILLMLDRVGIEASTGSACSAYDLKPSHVLLAIGQTAEFAHGSIRFSLGKDSNQKDIDHVISVLSTIAYRLTSISALTASGVMNTAAAHTKPNICPSNIYEKKTP